MSSDEDRCIRTEVIYKNKNGLIQSSEEFEFNWGAPDTKGELNIKTICEFAFVLQFFIVLCIPKL